MKKDLANREFDVELSPSPDELGILLGPHKHDKATTRFQTANEKFEYFGLFDPPGLDG